MSRIVRFGLPLMLSCMVLVGAAPLSSQPAGAGPLQRWMVSRNAIDLIDGYTGNTTLSTQAFDSRSTIETGARAAGWVTQRTVTFTAFGPPTTKSSFEYALDHHTIAAGTADVLYDDEDWSLTPPAERAAPATYMADFVRLAHAHGYQAVLAPAIDLARAMPCYKSSDSAWVNYVTDCDLPAAVAAAAPDVYEIQSQIYESGTPLGVLCGCYAWLVTQSAVQARLGAPLLDILSGLSTDDDGAVATAQDLYDDTMATQASIDGYWLNVPERSHACPRCIPGGAPQVAVAYLEMLGYSS